MKILFLSNYFNHHQSALGDGLWACTEGNFWFVEWEEMPSERTKMGCGVDKRGYVLPYLGNEALVERWLREAEVVIAGSAPEKLVRIRLQAGKLLLRYQERPLLKGSEPLKYLPRLLRWHWWNPPGKPIYLLCASAYTAGDYAKFGLFRGRAFRWGYFPACWSYDMESLMAGKHRKAVLWCGRMVAHKHPEAALLAAKQLKDRGYTLQVRFLGSGPMEADLGAMAQEYGLDARFFGVQSAAKVREHMEQAGIFLFSSDAGEGWGAVVNEAMNSGCALVASREAGSVPYLVEDGKNGLVYKSGDIPGLVDRLGFLLDHPQDQERLGLAAYQSIQTLWNGEEAARRLVKLSQELLAGGDGLGLYEVGPCSPA